MLIIQCVCYQLNSYIFPVRGSSGEGEQTLKSQLLLKGQRKLNNNSFIVLCSSDNSILINNEKTRRFYISFTETRTNRCISTDVRSPCTGNDPLSLLFIKGGPLVGQQHLDMYWCNDHSASRWYYERANICVLIIA